MSDDPIRVLLADDQRVVREGLAMLVGLLPGIEVVGTAADGEEAVRLAVARAADVVLMDLRMPRCDGVEATQRLADARPEARVIALTTYADEPTVLRALRAGARGYLTKDAGAEEIHPRSSPWRAARRRSTRPCRPSSSPRWPTAARRARCPTA